MLNNLAHVITWRSIIDITIITLGLFFIYSNLKRLGTWKTLTSIILIIFIYVLARFLDLEGILWLYYNVSQVALLGFIIMFQPEIRKLFDKAITPRRRTARAEDNKITSIITESVEALAMKKQGALIILRGKDDLERFISGGVPLGGEPSVALILSIFDTHSPGHDGAVIIENGKISKYGVRLPISPSEDLPKEYGTRHYAAAGLSELADSLVIAVSEERGTVTFFYQGVGRALENHADIVDTIEKHWVLSGKVFNRPHRKRWPKSWLELGMCFILAAVFWYSIVVGEIEIQEKVVSVPVEYIGTPTGMVLTGDKLSEVKAHLKGPKSGLESVSNLRIRIDLSNAQPGKQKQVISTKNINLSKKVELVDVQPSTINLEFTKYEEKQIKIKPQLVGSVPKPLKLASVEVIPNDVAAMVRSGGNKKETFELTTSPIYLNNIQSDTTIYSKIVIPPGIQPLDRKWTDVEVRIKVVEFDHPGK